MMNIKKIVFTFLIALSASAFYDYVPWSHFGTMNAPTWNALFLFSLFVALAVCLFMAWKKLWRTIRAIQADGWEDRQDIKKLMSKRRA